MVGAIIVSIGLWISFVVISLGFIALSVAMGYYGLKLIDKTEQWYKGQDNE